MKWGLLPRGLLFLIPHVKRRVCGQLLLKGSCPKPGWQETFSHPICTGGRAEFQGQLQGSLLDAVSQPKVFKFTKQFTPILT